jgi:hypothetical protein
MSIDLLVDTVNHSGRWCANAYKTCVLSQRERVRREAGWLKSLIMLLTDCLTRQLIHKKPFRYYEWVRNLFHFSFSRFSYVINRHSVQSVRCCRNQYAYSWHFTIAYAHEQKTTCHNCQCAILNRERHDNIDTIESDLSTSARMFPSIFIGWFCTMSHANPMLIIVHTCRHTNKFNAAQYLIVKTCDDSWIIALWNVCARTRESHRMCSIIFFS